MAVDTDYGTDLDGVGDLDPYGAVVSGTLVVAQACARRLSTPRGRVIDDPNYGFDLTQYINDDVNSSSLAALRAGTVSECLKDERVLTATCDAVLSRSGILTVTIKITTSDGPFTLVLSVSQTSVNVLSVT